MSRHGASVRRLRDDRTIEEAALVTVAKGKTTVFIYNGIKHEISPEDAAKLYTPVAITQRIEGLNERKQRFTKPDGDAFIPTPPQPRTF